MRLNKYLLIFGALVLMGAQGESCQYDSSDTVQRKQQERLLLEGTAQTGMPSIKNFRERKILKDILELRDQDGLVTYTYVFSDYFACFRLLGSTIGFGFPYSTQYSNPQKYIGNQTVLPQADPNGLFSPSSADGTWIVMQNPNGKDAGTGYFEPRISTVPFKLPESVLCDNVISKR